MKYVSNFSLNLIRKIKQEFIFCISNLVSNFIFSSNKNQHYNLDYSFISFMFSFSVSFTHSTKVQPFHTP